MAAILGSRVGRMAMSAQLMRGILDSIATRLDEARDILRYMTGLLVFLGLLGTFWGLIETVSSVGNVIQGLKPGGDAGSMFDTLARGSRRAAVRHGHFVLVVAVRPCRLADPRLPRSAIEPGAEPLLHRTGRLALDHGLRPRAASRASTAPACRSKCAAPSKSCATPSTKPAPARRRPAAMANLAEAIQGLVHHMRTEQQMIRDWVDCQAETQREIKQAARSLWRARRSLAAAKWS